MKKLHMQKTVFNNGWTSAITNFRFYHILLPVKFAKGWKFRY